MEEYGGNIIVEAGLNAENFDAGAAKLENRMKKAAQNVAKAERNLDALNKKLRDLQAAKVPTEEFANLTESVASAEKRLTQLTRRQDEMKAVGTSENSKAWQRVQNEIDRTVRKLENYDAAMQRMEASGAAYTQDSAAIEQTRQKIDEAATTLERYQIEQREAAQAVSEYNAQEGQASAVLQTVSDRMEKFRRRVIGLAKRVFVFTMITKALRAMRSALMSTIGADAQMSNSLAQIKGNLITAFASIYNFVVPAIRTLLSWIAKLTATIATFVNSIFGKTAAQASESAKALYDQAHATEAAGGAAEKAEKQLASFDTINKLSYNTDSGGGGGGTTGAVAPDFSGVSNIKLPEGIQNALDRIHESFGRILDALKEIWDSPIVKAIRQAVFSTLGRAFTRILDGVADIFEGIADIMNGDFSTGLEKIYSGLFKLIDPFGVIGKAITDTISNFKIMLTNVSDILEKLEKILPEPFAKLAKSVRQIVDGILKIFGGDLKDGLISIGRGIVNTLISQINILISGLNAILYPSRALIAAAGHVFGKNWTISDISIPKIPALAKGAVIPGGRAFLSVLGDQPAGQTNIETPLETMIDAFRKAGAGKQTIIIKIGDTEFKRFVYDAYNSEARRIGKSYA